MYWNSRSVNEFFSCHEFLKNKDYVVILKCPNRIFEYYLNKGFIIFIAIKNLEKLPSEIKDRIGAEKQIIQTKSLHVSTTLPSHQTHLITWW